MEFVRSLDFIPLIKPTCSYVSICVHADGFDSHFRIFASAGVGLLDFITMLSSVGIPLSETPMRDIPIVFNLIAPIARSFT